MEATGEAFKKRSISTSISRIYDMVRWHSSMRRMGRDEELINSPHLSSKDGHPTKTTCVFDT